MEAEHGTSILTTPIAHFLTLMEGWTVTETAPHTVPPDDSPVLVLKPLKSFKMIPRDCV